MGTKFYLRDVGSVWWPSETCKEKYCVRHLFSRIPHDTCPLSRSTQEQENLDCHECRGHVEHLEHKRVIAFSVDLRIHGSFREQDGGMFLRPDPEYVVESLVADWARTTEGACNSVRIQISRCGALNMYALVGFRRAQRNSSCANG